MAGNIKGITVEIGGSTTGLSKALTDVNKQSNALSGELKEVDRLLKLDPGNLTLVAQKQAILSDAVSATSEKLKTLKEVQGQVEQQFKSGDIGRSQYLAFQKELLETENKLDDLTKKSKEVSMLGAAFDGVKAKAAELHEKLEPIESGLKKVGSAAATIGSAGIQTVGTAVEGAAKGLAVYSTAALGAATAIGGLALSAADALGGIDDMAQRTGISAEEIQKYSYAAKLSGMETETLEKAMTKSQKSFADAKEGSASLQEAYSRLGVDISKVSNSDEAFSKTLNALADMQDETTRNALANDIFGKSYAELAPLLNQGAGGIEKLKQEAVGLGAVMGNDQVSAAADLGDNLDRLKTAASGAGNMLGAAFLPQIAGMASEITAQVPGISSALAGVLGGKDTGQLQDAITGVADLLLNGINDLLPTFLNGFNTVILSVVGAISETLPGAIDTILPTLLDGFFSLVSGLIAVVPELLPTIAEGALQLFLGLLDGLNQVIPQLMEMLPGLIENISNTLIENLPAIIEGGFQLLIGLITGLANATPMLVDKVVEMIPVIVESLMDNLPALIQAGIELVLALVLGIPKAIPALISAIPAITEAIWKTILETDWLDIGVQILKGIGDGLVEGVKAIAGNIARVAGDLVDGFKSFFGIHSPSTLFRDEIGDYLAQGIGVGFGDEMKSVSKTMQKAIPTSFDTEVSLNAKTGASYGESASGAVNFTQNNYSPKALSRAEIYRNTQRGLQLAAVGGFR